MDATAATAVVDITTQIERQGMDVEVSTFILGMSCACSTTDYCNLVEFFITQT